MVSIDVVCREIDMVKIDDIELEYPYVCDPYSESTCDYFSDDIFTYSLECLCTMSSVDPIGVCPFGPSALKEFAGNSSLIYSDYLVDCHTADRNDPGAWPDCYKIEHDLDLNSYGSQADIVITSFDLDW